MESSVAQTGKARQNRTVGDVFDSRNLDTYKDDGKIIRMKMKDLFEGVQMGTEVLVSGARQQIDLTNGGEIVASLFPYSEEEHDGLKQVNVLSSQKGAAVRAIFDAAVENKGKIVITYRKAPIAVMMSADMA